MEKVIMKFLGSEYLIRNHTGIKIFKTIQHLPIVDMHNHANVPELANNQPYRNLWQVMGESDHYVWEAMRGAGVKEFLITGNGKPQEKFMALCDIFPQLIGNPVYEWLHLDLRRIFDLDLLLNRENGEKIWHQCNAMLQREEFLPLNLLRRMNVELMCSTDDPVDLLNEHAQVNKAFGSVVLRPTWRPDKIMKIEAPSFPDYIQKLNERFNMNIQSFADVALAMRKSHDYFAANSALASDHGITTPPTGEISRSEADHALAKRLRGETLTALEINAFANCVLNTAAQLDSEKNWVFQLHLGAVRDVRNSLFDEFGPDCGGDICDSMLKLREGLVDLLNNFDNQLKVIVYSLDPAHQPMLASVCRAFGNQVRMGSAWWLCDSPIGMKRQLEYIGAVDLLSKFGGMVSDSRKILSYGSRFEMFRRILADVLGEMVENGQAPEAAAIDLASYVAYHGPKKFFIGQ